MIHFHGLILRIVSIVARFACIGTIARLYDDSVLNSFVLISAIGSVYAALYGFQTFHVCLRRSVKNDSSQLYLAQARIFLFSTVLTLIILCVFQGKIESYTGLPIIVTFLFITSEAIGFEVSRLAIIKGNNSLSNFTLALNSIVILLWPFISWYVEVNPVSLLPYFSLINVFTCIFIWLILVVKSSQSFSTEIQKTSSLKLVSESLPYIVSQILNMVMLNYTRFLVDLNLERESFVAYSILLSLASFVGTFLSVGVIAPAARDYVVSSKSGLLYKMNIRIILIGFSFIIIGFLAFPIIVKVLAVKELSLYRPEFVMLLFAQTLIGLSQIYQLEFLKQSKDWYNLVAYVSGAVVTILLGYYAIEQHKVMGATLTFLAAATALLIVRIALYIRYKLVCQHLDVVIYYEHISREWNSCFRLKNELSALGLSSVIIPIHYWKYLNILRYNPRLVVLPYLYSKNNNQHLMFEAVYGGIEVLNLHSEQIHDETTKVFQMPQDDYARSAIHVSWGRKFAKALVENGTSKNRIFIVGSIRNDDIASNQIKPKSVHENINKILIPTSFSKTFVSEEYIKKLTSLDSIDETSYRYKIAVTSKVRDQYFKDFYNLALNYSNIDFEFRPHPYVEVSKYISKFLEINKIMSLPKNISVRREGSIQDAIRSSDMVIAWYTSSVIDAVLMGLPTVIYDPIETPKNMRIPFLSYFNRIENLRILEKFIMGDYNSHQSKNLLAYIHEIYGPIDGRSSFRVASIIKYLIENNDQKQSKFRINSFAVILLKTILIDFTKYLALKINVLHFLRPFYKGVLEDCKADTNVPEVKFKHTKSRCEFRFCHYGFEEKI